MQQPIKFIRYSTTFACALALGACATQKAMTIDAGSGTAPALPPPASSLIPTVHVADATGWPEGAKPTPAHGLAVNAFAAELAHPRWLYVLPNGDVLVAETDAPPKPDDRKGFKGWVMKKLMSKAGSGTPSANRITLLRDADGDGVAETRTVFLSGLNSPFGMTLVGRRPSMSPTPTRCCAFTMSRAPRTSTAPARRSPICPAGTINHHWTKNVIASRDGSRALRDRRLEQQRRSKTALRWRRIAPTFSRSIRRPAPRACSRAAFAMRTAWTGSRKRARYGPRSTSATSSATISCPTTSPRCATAASTAGRTATTDSTSTRASSRSGPISSRRRSRPTMRSARTPPRSASRSTKAARCRRAIAAARSSASTARGTASRFRGYRVIFVPFENGMATGKPEDVLTGFVDAKGEAMGRPVGVAVDKPGALLVADDVGGRVWRITAEGGAVPSE